MKIPWSSLGNDGQGIFHWGRLRGYFTEGRVALGYLWMAFLDFSLGSRPR